MTHAARRRLPGVGGSGETRRGLRQSTITGTHDSDLTYRQNEWHMDISHTHIKHEHLHFKWGFGRNPQGAPTRGRVFG